MLTGGYSAQLSSQIDHKGISCARIGAIYKARQGPLCWPADYEYKPGTPQEANVLSRTIVNFVENSVRANVSNETDPIVISIPDLHGAAEVYPVFVRAIEGTRRRYPNRPIFTIFLGDFSPKEDPIYRQQIDGPLENMPDSYPGYFCVNLAGELAALDNVHVITILGNHEMQHPWRFLQMSRFFRKHNIPFLSDYDEWIREDWYDVQNFEYSIEGRPPVPRSETLASYLLQEDNFHNEAFRHFHPTQPFHIIGKTLIFPHTTAYAAYGGTGDLSKCYIDGFAQELAKACTGASTHATESWDDVNDGVFCKIANNFALALHQLCEANPGDDYLDVIVASHAKKEQTQDFLEHIFQKGPNARINEQNFPGQSHRFRVFIFGGHGHCNVAELIKINTGDGEMLDTGFCASSIFGQAANFSVFGSVQRPKPIQAPDMPHAASFPVNQFDPPAPVPYWEAEEPDDGNAWPQWFCTEKMLLAGITVAVFAVVVGCLYKRLSNRAIARRPIW
ncbi:MAG: hypothetical protein LBF84_02465 [Holosporales bacterium]|nr:hypothetical protein [Holosporales bacterium]